MLRLSGLRWAEEPYKETQWSAAKAYWPNDAKICVSVTIFWGMIEYQNIQEDEYLVVWVRSSSMTKYILRA